MKGLTQKTRNEVDSVMECLVRNTIVSGSRASRLYDDAC